MALLNKKVMTVKQLASKHGVPEADIFLQLTKGIKVEKEHTTKDTVAKRIALAHIAEDPKYYSKLSKIGL